MVFSHTINTLPSTNKNAPKITEIPITKGVIAQWFILFPAGHWCECHIQIKRGSQSILPANPEGYLQGEEIPFKSGEFIYIRSEPYNLTAYTYNEDTINAHKIYLTFSIMPIWTYSPYSETILRMVEDAEIVGMVI